MATRPLAVAFDVVETLMPLQPLRPRLESIGQPGELLELWFTRLLRDGMALSATGDYRPFPEVAASALRTVTGNRVDDEQVSYLLAGFDELPAHADAEPAIRRLAEAGVPVACLTNGSAGVAQRFVQRNGLSPQIERVISCEEIGSWKPPAVVYRYAARALEVPPGRLALVAVHAWDCHGANRAGLVSGWASRLEGEYPAIFTPADVVGDDLVQVADGLLGLPAP